MITISMNGKKYQAQEGENVLKVALREGIEIPYLCYQDTLSPFGACRLCMVEVINGGKPGLTTSCTLPVAEGLTLETQSAEVVRIRKVLLELYLSEAPGSQKISELAKKYGVDHSRFTHIDVTAKGDRCTLCGLCVRVCDEILGIGAINYAGRGTTTSINTPWYETSSSCIVCGACEYVCPADAIDIIDKDDERIMETWNKTTLKLKECEESMKHFATERLVELVGSKNTNILKELEGLSPDAKMRKAAAEFLFKPKEK
ncbi:MAG: 2Fe-2S iron-sulfur cluster-binding protein [Thermodesulfobacteriota bacterium]